MLPQLLPHNCAASAGEGEDCEGERFHGIPRKRGTLASANHPIPPTGGAAIAAASSTDDSHPSKNLP
jgi:hypothetical protein